MIAQNEITHVHQQPLAVMPIFELDQAKHRRNEIVRFTKEIMEKNIDYGIIPGTTKPTLFKAGAERLNSFFGLSPKFIIVEKVEDWTGAAHGGEPLFYYHYKCQLWRGDHFVAESDGSSNSRENKHRWRWVNESDVPPNMDKSRLVTRGGRESEFAFALEKSETTGQYGKPAEYWNKWHEQINSGAAVKIKKKARSGKELDAWERDSTVYRIPNDDIASQINTIQKMAQKRALVGTTLIAVNASEFFTQDLEDMDILDTGWPAAQTKPVVSTVVVDPASQSTPPAAVHDDPEPNLMDDEVLRRCYIDLHITRDTKATRDEASDVLDGVLKAAKLVDAHGNADLSKVNLGGRKNLLERVKEGKHDKWIEAVRKQHAEAAAATT